MKHNILTLFTIGSFFLPCAVQAWTASSAAQQTQLVELFTSQGCSSCPPADRWLTRLKSRNSLWQDIVPVAWHVTYWDYLGWPARHENQEGQPAAGCFLRVVGHRSVPQLQLQQGLLPDGILGERQRQEPLH